MDKKIQLSELLYLCFWGLMLFAKGIGLYDGQTLYKVFLVLGFLCIAAKMLITKYSYAEWGVIIGLLMWSTIVYLVSGEKGALICTVTIVALKNVSVKRAFEIGLGVWAVAFGGSFLFSLATIESVQTAVQTKNLTGAVLRYFMGQPHPNVLHISYLVLVALIIYCVKDNYNLKHLLALTIGNIVLFLYSYSFTGTLIVMIFIALSYYVTKRNISKVEYLLVKLFFPFCIAFSIIFPIVLKGRAYELADKIFNNRINFARHFLVPANMTWFGCNLADITTNIITMDNAFIFALVIYGVPLFILICLGYLRVISQYVKQKKNVELAMICCFLVAGITEPFLFNTSFKNLTLLFIGEQLFLMLGRKNTEKKEFALIRNKDIEIQIGMQWLKKVDEQIKQVWAVHKKVILSIAGIVATLIAVCIWVIYRPGEQVMAVQKDHLLVFERIRVTTTALVIGFVLTTLLSGIVYQITDSKRKQEN